jgi:hypothetical protein
MILKKLTSLTKIRDIVIPEVLLRRKMLLRLLFGMIDSYQLNICHIYHVYRKIID